MNRLIALAGSIALVSSTVILTQDAMQYGVKHLKRRGSRIMNPSTATARLRNAIARHNRANSLRS
jgi:hypothetical protein